MLKLEKYVCPEPHLYPREAPSICFACELSAATSIWPLNVTKGQSHSGKLNGKYDFLLIIYDNCMSQINNSGDISPLPTFPKIFAPTLDDGWKY